jgi:hypothetical protein
MSEEKIVVALDSASTLTTTYCGYQSNLALGEYLALEEFLQKRLRRQLIAKSALKMQRTYPKPMRLLPRQLFVNAR